MNIWTGLLFLEGAVADASLARELAGEDVATSDPASDADESRDTRAAPPFARSN